MENKTRAPPTGPGKWNSLNLQEESNDKDEFDWAEYYHNSEGLRFSFSSNTSTSPSNQMEVDVQGVSDWSPDQLDGTETVLEMQLEWETDFSHEFYLWNMDLELKYHPKDPLVNQPQVSALNRSALISWLSQVSRSFELFPETLFLTVNVIDRFLKTTPIALECLQLVGLAALLVSAKEIDIYHPTISELIELTSENYTRPHYLQMEKIVLKQLGFQLVVPTCVVFLDYYIQRKSASSGKQNVFVKRSSYILTRNVLELCLQNYRLSDYAPSALALGVMWVIEEYANGVPVGEPEIGHWEAATIKQCATDVESYLTKILTVPLSYLTIDTHFLNHLSAYQSHNDPLNLRINQVDYLPKLLRFCVWKGAITATMDKRIKE